MAESRKTCLVVMGFEVKTDDHASPDRSYLGQTISACKQDWLWNDYFNSIYYAFLLAVRAAQAREKVPAITGFSLPNTLVRTC